MGLIRYWKTPLKPRRWRTRRDMIHYNCWWAQCVGHISSKCNRRRRPACADSKRDLRLGSLANFMMLKPPQSQPPQSHHQIPVPWSFAGVVRENLVHARVLYWVSGSYLISAGGQSQRLGQIDAVPPSARIATTADRAVITLQHEVSDTWSPVCTKKQMWDGESRKQTPLCLWKKHAWIYGWRKWYTWENPSVTSALPGLLQPCSHRLELNRI